MRRGFTLIELTVVVIVIGLVVGAVVVGRDLLHGARLRAQVWQLEQFDGALGAFRAKYASLPGDLSASHAAALGFVARSGEPGRGDGNGLLDACEAFDPFSSGVPLGCEIVLFWSDLASARMVSGTFSAAADAYIVITVPEDAFQYFPKAVIAASWDAVVVPVRCVSTGHYYMIVRLLTAVPPGSASIGRPVHARDAQWLDSKMDDGMPRTGRVRERSMGFGVPDGFFCDDNPPIACVTPGNTYNLQFTVAAPGGCAPQVHMSGM